MTQQESELCRDADLMWSTGYVGVLILPIIWLVSASILIYFIVGLNRDALIEIFARTLQGDLVRLAGLVVLLAVTAYLFIIVFHLLYILFTGFLYTPYHIKVCRDGVHIVKGLLRREKVFIPRRSIVRVELSSKSFKHVFKPLPIDIRTPGMEEVIVLRIHTTDGVEELYIYHGYVGPAIKAFNELGFRVEYATKACKKRYRLVVGASYWFADYTTVFLRNIRISIATGVATTVIGFAVAVIGIAIHECILTGLCTVLALLGIYITTQGTKALASIPSQITVDSHGIQITQGVKHRSRVFVSWDNVTGIRLGPSYKLNLLIWDYMKYIAVDIDTRSGSTYRFYVRREDTQSLIDVLKELGKMG
jgi:hypothetical protein